MSKYQLYLMDKSATVDNYQEGETDEGNNFWIGETLTGDTIEEVIRKACDFVGGDFDGVDKCYSIEIDAELGRIDFQTMENDNGDIVTEAELELWRNDQTRLWACYYTGTISEVKAVDLTKVTA